MFKDIELKTNYHKERIIKAFVNKGIYADNKLINSQLNNIELRLSIFKSPTLKHGEKVNVKELNSAIISIYNDLKILYEILYEITVIEYNKFESYINTHLIELEQSANMYLKRTKLESNSTSIGQSLLFKYDNFEINKKDNHSVIDLGKIKVEDCSKIICMADINNVEHKNMVFKFKKDDNSYFCNSYSYNHDTFVFPGTQKVEEHSAEIMNGQTINSMTKLNIIPLNISTSKFYTLAGKNTVFCKYINDDGNIESYNTISIDNLSFSKHCYIDFYIYNGDSVSFNFNKKPLATNFNTDNNVVENLDKIHHFFMEVEAGFAFNMEVERGSVYSIEEKTIVNQGNLYYSGQSKATDYLVLEYLKGESQEYSASIELYNTSISLDDINSIMIKNI